VLLAKPPVQPTAEQVAAFESKLKEVRWQSCAGVLLNPVAATCRNCRVPHYCPAGLQTADVQGKLPSAQITLPSKSCHCGPRCCPSPASPALPLPGQVESLDGELAKAYQEYVGLEADLSYSKVWFWRWRAGYRERVLEKQPGVDAAWASVRALHKRQEWLFNDAKSQLGLWSEAGVGESRNLFWWVRWGSALCPLLALWWPGLFVGKGGAGEESCPSSFSRLGDLFMRCVARWLAAGAVDAGGAC
jgi:hypothetical protein